MQKPTDIVTETSTEWDAIMSISLRRSHMLEYLKRVCSGQTLYFNSILLTTSLISEGNDIDKKTKMLWYYLGLSIGQLMPIKSSATFMRSILILLSEYSEYDQQFSKYEQRRQQQYFDGIFMTGPVFSNLLTPPLSFDLDYIHLLSSLCDVISELYMKCVDWREQLEGAAAERQFIDDYFRLDAKLKEVFFIPFSRELNRVCDNIIVTEINQIDPIHYRKLI